MSPGSAGSLLDVLVIGGGQAGLAMGYHLAQSGRSFQIVDAGAEIGQTWQARWDSLQLFTSSRYDNLPGLPFPAARGTYPGKDDVARYLQAYAAKHSLPVRLTTSVTSLTRGDDTYVAKAGGEVLEARQVVVATGPFQVPFIPAIADALDPGVHQIHSAHYRRPETLPAGKVLVVGAANSGCQIAQELSATHSVELSAGQRLPAIPQRPLGRDTWAWATALRLDKVTAESRLGKRLAGRDQVIGATALRGIRDVGAVRPGQRVLVNGAARRRRHLRRPHCAHRGREAHTGPRPDVPAGRHGRGPAPRGAGTRTRQGRHHRGIRPARGTSERPGPSFRRRRRSALRRRHQLGPGRRRAAAVPPTRLSVNR
jgi:putative flavoprotein involved in K+ transport